MGTQDQNTAKTRNVLKKSNIEAPSPNHCCRAKAVRISYSECGSVALVIRKQTASAVLHCRLRPLRPYHILPYYLIHATIFAEKIY